MKIRLLSSLTISVIALAAATAANAGTRVNEVNGRVQNQQQRIQAGVQAGTINAKQAVRDEKTLTRVQTQESKAEAKNDGHLTKGQQKHFNKELNHNSKRIHRQRQN